MKIQFSEHTIRVRFSKTEALELVQESYIHTPNEFLKIKLALDVENQVTHFENEMIISVVESDFIHFLNQEIEQFSFQTGKTSIAIEKDLAQFRTGLSIL
jgi:hypothetical protein